MKFLYSKNKRGFTLLETLTSVAILTLTIIGPLTVIMGSSTYARQTKDVMGATYLAEEAVEMIQNRYDSIYVFCNSNPDDEYCEPLNVDETPGEIAWRQFKNQLTALDGNPSCYEIDNVDGCSFDFIDMLEGVTTTPTRYDADDAACLYLVGMTDERPGIEDQEPTQVTTYVCKGVQEHLAGQASGVQYTRKVYLEKLPAVFEGILPEDEQYNGDVRIKVEVLFRGANGVQKTLSIIRFLHARP